VDALIGPLRGVWQYRGLVAGLVRRDLQMRSLRAIWGSAWMVIQPAIQIAIYTLVFSQVLAAKLPGNADPFAYSLYLCAGVLPWGWFTEMIGRSQTLFVEQAALMKAIRFPRTTLPTALAISTGIHFAIVVAIFLVVLAAVGHWPGMPLLGALPLLAIWAALAIGIGILCGTLNVFFRDVGYAVGIALQFWFWLTPIVYPIAIVPDALRPALAWNPLLPLVAGLQRIVVEKQWPLWDGVPVSAAFAVVVAAIGLLTFRALASDLLDEL
jgi:lipopolysaccharide transport system permease protein